MRTLYPAIEPYREFTLKVSDLHTLHIEECGTPEGIPVVYLHGAQAPAFHPPIAASSIRPATASC